MPPFRNSSTTGSSSAGRVAGYNGIDESVAVVVKRNCKGRPPRASCRYSAWSSVAVIVAIAIVIGLLYFFLIAKLGSINVYRSIAAKFLKPGMA